MSNFPFSRLRRLRNSDATRALVQETRISPSDFVYPIFVTHGRGVRRPIESMPGIFQLSLDYLIQELEEINALGIPSVLLFGITDRKDDEGSEAYSPTGIIQEAIRIIKQTSPDLIVMADVCLCEYTTHGHCGIIREGVVDNDPTLEILSQVAVCQADAGADIVAPSAMMDGQVASLRLALDDSGHETTSIMSYSAKYASSFYGPFRVAAESAPQEGDRRGYQMDPPNSRQAILEIEQDIAEGADIVMVKPALAYLDVIAAARAAFDVPIAAYNVSGEFGMITAAAERGWVHRETAIMETLTGIKRAGADMILTYFAKEVAEILK